MRRALVMRAGQLRARDPLEGLTPAMRTALVASRNAILAPARQEQSRMVQSRLIGRSNLNGALCFAQTPVLTALARRGLVKRISTISALYCLTATGLECAVEISRRAATRAELEAARA